MSGSGSRSVPNITNPLPASPPQRPRIRRPGQGSASSSASSQPSSSSSTLTLASLLAPSSSSGPSLRRRASDAARHRFDAVVNHRRTRSNAPGAIMTAQPQPQPSAPPTINPDPVIPNPHSAADLDPAAADRPTYDAELDAEIINAPDVVGPLSPAPPPGQAPLPGPASPDPDEEVFVPDVLRKGVAMLKVSAKKTQQRKVWLAPEQGQLLWESKKSGWMNLENIRELRFSHDARGFREQFKISSEHEPRWISIIFTMASKFKALHLIALTDDHFKLWKETLTVLHDQRKQLMGGLDQMRKRQGLWLKQYWTQADRSCDQVLDFEEVVKLCEALNIATTPELLKLNFEAADTKKRGFLDFGDFQTFVKLLKRRPEIESIFSFWSEGKDVLSLAGFSQFLLKEQKSTLPQDSFKTIYSKFCDPQSGGMQVEGFTSFLLSSDNTAFPEKETKVYNDMSRQICEYYISSSHNTYLVGGQLHGESTSEGYIRALQQGCRCVELDVWDGPEEPMVYHGRTLTSKITVREALLAISKYAFVASPYPVILSMEVHCELAQQDQLAKIMTEVLGDALVRDRLDDDDPARPIEALPSPESLKFKFLLKAKNMFVVKEMQAATEAEEVSETSESSTSSDSEFKRVITRPLRALGVSVDKPRSPPAVQTTNPLSDPSAPQLTPSSTSTSVSSAASPTSSTFGRLKPKKSSGASKTPMSFALAGLIVYTVGIKMRGFNKKEQYSPEHVISLGEKRAFKMVKEATNDLVAHNRTHLLRTYPAGLRFTSSNYLPHHLWAVGVQLAAINWQTYDLGAELNTAMFLRNGRCGYVLKPEVLRSKGGIKDKELLSTPKPFKFSVSVISAQQLPRKRNKDHEEENGPINPYVEVEILAPGNSAVSEKTKTAWKNGFAPVWNESFTIPFEVIGAMTSLVFVRLTIWENETGGNDRPLAKYCISVSDLQPGYRHLPLYDNLGQQHLFSSLFIKSSLAPA